MADHKLLPLELGDGGETDQPATTDTGVCTLVADDSNAVALAALEQAIKDASGTTKTTAPKIGAVLLTGGSSNISDAQLFEHFSVTVDACAVLLTDATFAKLVKDGTAVQWATDAFGHLKAIGFNAAATPLLDKAGVEGDEGVDDLDGSVEAAKRRRWDREPKMRRLA